ncbi:HET-domain-containing protein [Fusarium austroafricanum]|uniref:HET-domain-containing protein n=1 Tax=Fusarium austroafricanum TaxID=2364996 RepID=A0A8H4KKG2_9HYPO|nr:HET-domain-containing protein [Fusarium austroafricanum]
MNPTLPYIYSPLDRDIKEIRLLTIFPSHDRDQPVCCALTPTTLSSARSYKALSYVWGDPTSTAKLSVDRAEVKITKNLAIALRYIRHGTEEQVFWIDGICINQADMSERCEQVLLMAEIFQQAERVVAWLGEEENDSSVALHMLSNLAGVWSASTDHDVNPGLSLNGIPNAFELAVWTGIRHVFLRAWWTRLWIYQEVMLARSITLVCGQDYLDWEDLANAYRLLTSLLSPHNGLYLGILDTGPVVVVMQMSNWTSMVVNRAWGSQVQPSMLHLLRSCLIRQSTDPRDRFYAVLGLASDAGDFGKPSYTISAEEVFEKFAQKIINRGQSLELLSYARSGLITPEEGISCSLDFSILPSWVPHWHCGTKSSRIDPTWYRAGALVQPGFHFEPRTLFVNGVMADMVSEIVTQPFLTKEKRHWFNAAMAPGLSSPYPTGIPRLQAFFRTVLADCTAPGMPRLDISSVEFKNLAAAFLLLLPSNLFDDGKVLFETVGEKGIPDYALGFLKLIGQENPSMNTHELLDLYFGSVFKEPEVDLHRGRHNAKSYAIAEAQTTRGRNFFMTNNGYMGLTSSNLRVSDGIYVIPGCPLPMILRKHQPYFHVVGECFVLGLMDGEGLSIGGERQQLQELGLHLETFKNGSLIHLSRGGDSYIPFGVEAEPCRPSTTGVTSIAESLSTIVSDSTATSLDPTAVTTLTDATTTVQEESTATTTETGVAESLSTIASDTTTVSLDVTTTTTLADTITTVQAESTTTTAAPGCAETQLFVNPGFDNSRVSSEPWITNGGFTQSEPRDGINAVTYVFNGGGSNSGFAKQTLTNLDGTYDFSYYYRVLSISPGADYTCDLEVNVGDASLRGNFEDSVGGWKSGSVFWSSEGQNVAQADVQLTVSCSREYNRIQVNVDSFGFTRKCSGSP